MVKPVDALQELLDTISIDSLKNSIVAVVGAGASVASGLKTFRGADGLYKDAHIEQLASRTGFINNPYDVWAWYKARIEIMLAAEPNAVHHGLVELEKMGVIRTVITQNVDGLHRRAGQQRLIEIHGTAIKTHCFNECGISTILEEPPDTIPVSCECGSYQRPSVVWFGEQLNYAHLVAVEEALSESKLVLSIGTSGVVYPVAQFPFLGKQYGAKLIDFNISPSPITDIVDVFMKGPAEDTLPVFVDLLKEKLD